MVSPSQSMLINTRNDNPNAVPQLTDTSNQESYFDKKWTYEEYLEELKKPVEHPDPNDINDPLYYKKYAHTVPPPAAYYFVPDRKDSQALNEETKNDRRVYFGWNNLT